MAIFYESSTTARTWQKKLAHIKKDFDALQKDCRQLQQGILAAPPTPPLLSTSPKLTKPECLDAMDFCIKELLMITYTLLKLNCESVAHALIPDHPPALKDLYLLYQDARHSAAEKDHPAAAEKLCATIIDSAKTMVLEHKAFLEQIATSPITRGHEQTMAKVFNAVSELKMCFPPDFCNYNSKTYH